MGALVKAPNLTHYPNNAALRTLNGYVDRPSLTKWLDGSAMPAVGQMGSGDGSHVMIKKSKLVEMSLQRSLGRHGRRTLRGLGDGSPDYTDPVNDPSVNYGQDYSLTYPPTQVAPTVDPSSLPPSIPDITIPTDNAPMSASNPSGYPSVAYTPPASNSISNLISGAFNSLASALGAKQNTAQYAGTLGYKAGQPLYSGSSLSTGSGWIIAGIAVLAGVALLGSSGGKRR
jgi:hypothetical protein